MIIDLTEEEKELCRDTAEKRNAPKQAAGIKSRRVDDKKTDLEIHVMGVMGECAVAKAFGIGVMSVEFWLHGDNGIDLEIAGLTVEVKTRGVGRDFAVVSSDPKDLKADVGILVWQEGDSHRIVGWVSRADFILKHEMIKFGGLGLRATVRHRKMRNILAFEKHLTHFYQKEGWRQWQVMKKETPTEKS